MTLRRAAVWGLRIAVSAGLMWLTFRLVGDGIDLAAIRLEAPRYLLAALALLGAMVVLLAFRWRMVARGLDGAPPALGLGGWAALIWAGIAVSQVIPGGLTGDAVRVVGLRQHGTRLARAFETVALDRAVGLTGLALLGGGAWLALGGRGGVATVGAVAAAGAAGLWFGWRWLDASGRATGLRDRLRIWAGFVLSARGAAALALAAFTHALNVALFLCVAHAVGLDLPAAASFLAVPAGLLAAAVPVSLGGWGVREIAIANGFALVGGDPASAVQASVLFGGFHLCANAPALLFLTRLRLRSGASQ